MAAGKITQYKALLLTAEESKDVMNCGWRFAHANKDRWRDMGGVTADGLEANVNGYDVAKTYIVFDDTVYTIFKDYVIPDEGIKLFILKDRNLATDRIAERDVEELPQVPSPEEIQASQETPAPEEKN